MRDSRGHLESLVTLVQELEAPDLSEARFRELLVIARPIVSQLSPEFIEPFVMAADAHGWELEP